MATFLRTTSTSSLSSIGSDNPDVTGKGAKAVQDPGKNKTIVQRTRDALGDIGNRLKKNPSAAAGKAAPLAKKEVLGAGVASKEFAVPANRPPRAVATRPRTKSVDIPVTRHQLTTRNEVPLVHKALPPSHTFGKPLKAEAAEVKAIDKPICVIAKLTTTQEIEKNKENVPLKEVPAVENKPETEPTEENEYNPKLSSEAPTDTFSSDRLNVIVDIDKDEWNPMLVQVYVKEIYDYVFALEKKYPVRIRYLEGRLINSRMRAVLLDWLVEVHHQFSFMPETLYMAAKVLDRFLQTDRSITRKQLQLVGVTAMYVAAKYEEVCTPAVQDFAAVSDNAFTVSDVIKMEQTVLSTLSFDMAFPPAVLFLRRFSKAASATMAIHSMAKYIMELSLVDYAACHLFPSEQAAGSLALALVIMEDKKLLEVWNPTVQHYSRYSFEDIKPIVSLLAGILSRANEETNKLKAVFKKYTGKRLSSVSTAPELLSGNWKKRILQEVCKM